MQHMPRKRDPIFGPVRLTALVVFASLCIVALVWSAANMNAKQAQCADRGGHAVVTSGYGHFICVAADGRVLQ